MWILWLILTLVVASRMVSLYRVRILVEFFGVGIRGSVMGNLCLLNVKKPGILQSTLDLNLVVLKGGRYYLKYASTVRSNHKFGVIKTKDIGSLGS